MKLVLHMRQVIKRLPPAAAVVLGFGTIVGLSIILVLVLPPAKDANQQCVDQCNPRTGQLVPDKDYPMGKTGYRSKCECNQSR
jgi:hypothetical protein